MGNCGAKDFESMQLAYLTKQYGKDVGDVTFKSANSIYPGCSLFGQSDTIRPDDVWQNRSETCYLLASLAAVAVKHPERIRSLFTEAPGSTTAEIHVTVYCSLPYGSVKSENHVTVNRLLPVYSHNTPLFATPRRDNAIWPAIYQKAFAKVHGGYGDIDNHFAYNGLTAITNCVDFSYYRFKNSRWTVYNVPHTQNWKPDWHGNTDWTGVGDDAVFYQLLNDAWTEGFPMTASNDRHVVSIVNVTGNRIRTRDQAEWNSAEDDIDLSEYPFIGVCRFK
jgi:hypothetical protein